ncbi:hypothetical protein [uncultured Arcticibacterium sp.]|uniref:hypothetical protein n=1 Tax=uncultured Arcticibacterium sp. TaxID=2173042 RepID=UPI0030FC4246
MKVSVFFTILLFSFVSNGQQINVKSDWSETVSSNEISEAGLDYAGTLTSDAAQSSISFSGGKFLGFYFVSVSKEEIDWDSRLSVWIRRTGDGNGSPFATISGGTNYMELSDSEQTFYSGWNATGGTRRNVPVQYQMRGVSVVIPAKSYLLNVTYTLSD